MEDYIEINIDDEIYPSKLKNIKKPPKKLYAKGNLDLFRRHFNCNSRIKRMHRLWI